MTPDSTKEEAEAADQSVHEQVSQLNVVAKSKDEQHLNYKYVDEEFEPLCKLGEEPSSEARHDRDQDATQVCPLDRSAVKEHVVSHVDVRPDDHESAEMVLLHSSGSSSEVRKPQFEPVMFHAQCVRDVHALSLAEVQSELELQLQGEVPRGASKVRLHQLVQREEQLLATELEIEAQFCSD